MEMEEVPGDAGSFGPLLEQLPWPALWTKVSIYVRHGALRHENLGSALGPGGPQSNSPL